MYSARITRLHRMAFVILADGSGSMEEDIVYRGKKQSKARAVASIINMFIDELMHRSQREDGMRYYFDVAVLVYSGRGVEAVLDPKGFVTLTDLRMRTVPTRVEHIMRTLPDGVQTPAAIVENCWVEPMAFGDTPMGAALVEADRLVRRWCADRNNRESFPPMVINITDGEATDAGPADLKEYAAKIKGHSTADGGAILFNVHLHDPRGGEGSSVRFPSAHSDLPPLRHARTLFDMSSTMPECYNDIILEHLPGAWPPFRAMSYNCNMDDLFDMLTIGSISKSVII